MAEAKGRRCKVCHQPILPTEVEYGKNTITIKIGLQTPVSFGLSSVLQVRVGDCQSLFTTPLQQANGLLTMVTQHHVQHPNFLFTANAYHLWLSA